MATVFFSWQSDTPSRNGRTFLENALRSAIGRIVADLDIEAAVRDELAFDRDTKGVPGQPAIVDTIFMKIDRAAVFVPDLTFVGLRAHTEPQRPTPNPNVLIEYGWALKTLGHGRIVPVMNVAYGSPEGEAMPFDMRHLRRPIFYDLPDGGDKEAVRKEGERLSKVLERALRDVLASPEYAAILPKPPPPPRFPAAVPKGGQSRFRAPGEALGISDSDRNAFQRAPPPEIHLQDGPTMWLRLMPTAATGRMWSRSELKRLLLTGGIRLLPLGSSYGPSFMRAADGVGTYQSLGRGEPVAESVAFAFETGEVWAIDAWLLGHAAARSYGEQPGIPFIGPIFIGALEAYADVLSKLALSRPFQWMAGLEGVKGFGLYWPTAPGRNHWRYSPQGSMDTNAFSAQGTFEPGETAVQALEPFFAAVFEHCGLQREHYAAADSDR